MKAHDAARVSLLRGIIAAIKNAKVEQRGADVPAERIAMLVRREIKKCEEVAEIARRGGRDDVVQRNESEVGLLQELLPPSLSPDELEGAIRQTRRMAPPPLAT